MPKYYLDTSIWIDYYEKRKKNGKHALKLILKIVKENSIILYSDLHIREFKDIGYNIDEINNIFKIVKPGNIRRVHISKDQNIESDNIAFQSKIPKKDTLHAIMARDNETILVATDKHFKKIKHIIEVKKPEDVLNIFFCF